MEEIRCFGCGAIIQTEDKNKIGYTPKNALDKEHVFCQRCFRIKNYNELQKTELTSDDFLAVLQEIGEKDCLVVYVVDIFDFNGSMIKGLPRHLQQNDILVIGNKRDILPKSLKDIKIEHWVRRQLKEEGIKPVDVIIGSGIKNYQLDTIMDAIQEHRHNRDAYIIGVTNVGKSSLINSLLAHLADEKELFKKNQLITTSAFPGTTLGLIEIPLDESSSLYDTPGIINTHQMAHMVDIEDLKAILPKSELRPKSYQIDAKQTLFFGGLARFDYTKGEHLNLVCYFPKDLMIHRTKSENADGLFNRHQTLKPEIQGINEMKDMASYHFSLPNYKVDVVISGLGFITMKAPGAKIQVWAPKEVGVFIREALI